MKLLNNPDVTVRTRGVMEKCTYCVQRIVERTASSPSRRTAPLRDGEVVTACQAACPTRAIVFGDLNDKTSARREGEGQPAELRPPGRAQHAAAHDVPGQAHQPEPEA